MAKSETLSERVYEALKKKIIERRIRPDAKVDLSALQEELGVSRMPVVDAISRLKCDGLVISRPRVGTFVAPLNIELFEEIFETRLMIEYWATPKIILNLRDQDVLEMRALLDDSRVLLENVSDDTFDYPLSLHYDQQFHQGLLALCGNSYLIQFYQSLNVHFQIARAYSRRALARSIEGQTEHEAILEAFAQRDVDLARDAQREHAERSRQGIIRLLEEFGEL